MTTSSHYHSHVDDAVAAGRRLKEARIAAGLSQRQLAFPGCSAAYISRLEAGQRVASLQLLRKIAAKLARRRGVPRDRHRPRAVRSPTSSSRRTSRCGWTTSTRPATSTSERSRRVPIRARRRRRSEASAGSRSARAIRAQAVDSIEEALATGAVDRGSRLPDSSDAGKGVRGEGRARVRDRRVRARQRRQRPRPATRSSRPAARSGSRTPTSTAATSGGPRSCWAARSRGHRRPSIRRSARASTGRSRGCTR